MLLLLFFVLIIQSFSYWIFEPIAYFLRNLLEIRLLPTIALVSLIVIFSGKNFKPHPLGKKQWKSEYYYILEEKWRLEVDQRRRSISQGIELMFLLLFFVSLIQFFSYWVFEPVAFFLEYVFEIRLLPIIALISFILLFSANSTRENQTTQNAG